MHCDTTGINDARKADVRLLTSRAACLSRGALGRSPCFTSGCSETRSYNSADILAWAWQLSEAVAVLSTAHIYHGDLRAPNILVSPSGHLIVADFGVGLRLDAAPSCLT